MFAGQRQAAAELVFPALDLADLLMALLDLALLHGELGRQFLSPCREVALLVGHQFLCFAPYRLGKDRIAGATGLVARIGYDMRSARYQRTYQLGRLSWKGDKFEPLEPSDWPWWAEHAKAVIP